MKETGENTDVVGSATGVFVLSDLTAEKDRDDQRAGDPAPDQRPQQALNPERDDDVFQV